MDANHKWIAFYTMLRKDVTRIFRIWVQTFLPSVVTSILYFSIFGAGATRGTFASSAARLKSATSFSRSA